MSEPLAGLLDGPAAQLYQRLVAAGRLSLAGEPELDSSGELAELIEAGFARRRFIGEPVVVPVEPSTRR